VFIAGKSYLAYKLPYSNKMKLGETDWYVIVSTLGCLGWTMTIFFGGMIMFLFSASFIVIPIIIVYIIAIIKIINEKGKWKIYWFILLALPWMIIGSESIYYAEVVQGDIILSGYYHEERYIYSLNFRKDGNCDMVVEGMFGYTERIPGKYSYSDHKIYFSKKPYPNNFLSDSMFVDESKRAIYMCNTSGNACSNPHGQADHFTIDRNMLKSSGL